MSGFMWQNPILQGDTISKRVSFSMSTGNERLELKCRNSSLIQKSFFSLPVSLLQLEYICAKMEMNLCQEFLITSERVSTSSYCAIVMQYGGKQLDEFLSCFEKKGTPELRKIVEDLLMQVACGIYDIHQQGLMHRDIKGRFCLEFW